MFLSRLDHLSWRKEGKLSWRWLLFEMNLIDVYDMLWPEHGFFQGKGLQKTYWLLSKKGFNPTLVVHNSPKSDSLKIKTEVCPDEIHSHFMSLFDKWDLLSWFIPGFYVLEHMIHISPDTFQSVFSVNTLFCSSLPLNCSQLNTRFKGFSVLSLETDLSTVIPPSAGLDANQCCVLICFCFVSANRNLDCPELQMQGPKSSSTNRWWLKWMFKSRNTVDVEERWGNKRGIYKSQSLTHRLWHVWLLLNNKSYFIICNFDTTLLQ